MTTAANQLFRRTEAVRAFAAEIVFYDPVFEGMKRQYDESSAGFQEAGDPRKRALDGIEFAVDRDPERLKDGNGSDRKSVV